MTVTGWLLVGLIGGLAATARYLLDAAISRRHRTPFPLGILGVNVLGCLLVGLVAGSGLEGQTLVIVAGGAIGSFTTFSTLILDTDRLGQGDRRLAAVNVAASLAAGFAAFCLGHWMAGG